MNLIRFLFKVSEADLTDNNRLYWFQSVALVGLLSGLLLTSSSWSTDRTYPLSPIITVFKISSESQDLLFLITLISLVIALLNVKFRKYLLGTALLSLACLVLLDITRLQPWILHYGAILFIFSFFIPKRYLSQLSLLNALRIIVVGIYFWSGIQKINYRFFTEIFPWFTEPLWATFGETGAYVAIIIGLFIPFIEAGIAVGLLTKHFRKISIIGSLLMMMLVLTSIGPFGHSWNSSVWPWNLAIFGMVILLFVGTEFSLRKFCTDLRKNTLAHLMILIFWIMPAGNFFGLTDNYLSWSLYSGKVPEASILGNQSFLETLSSTAENGELMLVGWTHQDLNLVPYPETRVFIDVFEKICNKNTSEPLTLLIKSNFSNFEKLDYQRTHECNQSTK